MGNSLPYIVHTEKSCKKREEGAGRGWLVGPERDLGEIKDSFFLEKVRTNGRN